MIRKKKKKIIRIRNPYEQELPERLPKGYIPKRTLDFLNPKMDATLEYDVEMSIAHGMPDEFEYLLFTWRNGSDCFDCDQEVLSCSCEPECEDCGHLYDACNCNRTAEETAKITWEFIKIVMSERELKAFKQLLIRSFEETLPYTDVYNKIIKSKDLYKPSYPKYKKIAKELFEV